MFSICVQFLQGRVAAARTDDPTRLEWPIHPGRLFMAMVAASDEAGLAPTDRDVLRFLETIDPPMIVAPVAHERLSSIDGQRRQPCTTFVVVNDTYGSKTDPLSRGKQPRTFASGYVGQAVTRYVFDAPIEPSQLESLRRICQCIVRLGHSSSLVRCWIETSECTGSQSSDDVTTCNDDTVSEDATCDNSEHPAPSRWYPAQWSHDLNTGLAVMRRHSMRTVSAGTLDRLDRAFNRQAIQAYDELALIADARPATPQSKKALKELKAKFPGAPKIRPTSTPPSINTYTNYRLVGQAETLPVLETDFDPAMIVLTINEGNVVGLESTLALAGALRGTILKENDGAQPAWLTGHDPSDHADSSGQLNRSDQPTRQNHLAIVPLGHVAAVTRVASQATKFHKTQLPETQQRHSTRLRANIFDGHLLGLALVLPRGLTRQQSSSAFARMMYDDLGEPRNIQLVTGHLGKFELCREDRARPPRALDPRTWVGPSRTWASVTPVVLDRHPKSDYRQDRSAWQHEVIQTITRSCQHIGIDSAQIDSMTVAPHGMLSGVPSARPARGFPLLTASEGKPGRQQVHVVIQFKQSVRGPLILGAGRFRGYGFCKPVEVRS